MSHFRIVFLLFFAAVSSMMYGQSVSGIIVDSDTGLPVQNAGFNITLDPPLTSVSDQSGAFQLKLPAVGRYNYTIEATGYEMYFSNVVVNEGSDTDLGTIRIYPLEKDQESLAAVLSESDLTGSDESTEVSSVLTASMDEFTRTASFDFGIARFKVRGYADTHDEIYLNGMPMNDLEDGFAAWSVWGGLNDVMRRSQYSTSLEPSFFSFGGLGGSRNISTLASDQYKQFRASYALTNRNYRHRAMMTYSTGMTKSGWAFSLSGSRRWAQEGYTPGTFYDGYSYLLSVDKKLGSKNLLNFTFLNAPSKIGRSLAGTKEVYEITGDIYYNSTWGFQNGEKRNSRVATSNQPVAIFRHIWNPTAKTALSTSLGFLTGKYGLTRLEWYNGSDPRPDYYQYLPSYRENESEASTLRELLESDPGRLQINWEELYLANILSQETIYNANGVEGNHVTGRLSQYIIEDQRSDPTKLSFNSYIETSFTDNISLDGGLTYQFEKIHYFKTVEDLLGGEFYLNFDKFAERDFPDQFDFYQNDLNQPNKLVYEGDTFGYNYQLINTKLNAWAKTLFVFNKVDFFVAGNISKSDFWRDGFYRNGKFAENSFGESEKSSFFNYGIKTGITFKIDGRNYVYANGLYMTKPPFVRNAFISPRTRNQLVENLNSETIFGGEATYLLRAPNVTVQATAYYTEIRDQIRIMSFYHESEQSFVNYILTGINQTHQGVELAARYKLTPAFSLKGVAAVGSYLYTSRPTATISQDNTAKVISDREIYMKNYRVFGTPQQAYSVALSYNSPNYWFVNLSFNYFDDIYLDFNPDRRTQFAVEGVDKNADPELWHKILDQEKLPSGYIVNLFGGKSWKIRDYYLMLNLGINNLLDNKTLITGGFEQLRFDYFEKNTDQFPPKYYYVYGLTYYLNLGFRF